MRRYAVAASDKSKGLVCFVCQKVHSLNHFECTRAYS